MGVCTAVKAKLMQGDAYPLPVYITIDGAIATPENVSGVKIRVGPFSDYWPQGGVTNEKGVWLFPLTAEKSARLPAGYNQVQARVYVDGYAVGTGVTRVLVGESVV